MAETDSGAPEPPPEGPPARSPAPAPDGFVPREWIETHHAHVRGQIETASEGSEAQPQGAGRPPAPTPPVAFIAQPTPPVPGMPGMTAMPPPPPRRDATP